MYINAQNHKIIDAYKLNNDVNEIKKYLNCHGPVLFGFKKFGNNINDILKLQKFSEILNIILNKENNISESDKNSINEFINILNKYINNNDYKPHFKSYYDELNNINNKLYLNIQNLINKYSKKYDERFLIKY